MGLVVRVGAYAGQANSCAACTTTAVLNVIQSTTNPTQGATPAGDYQAAFCDAGYSLSNGSRGVCSVGTCADQGADSCTACTTTEVLNALQFTTDPTDGATSAVDCQPVSCDAGYFLSNGARGECSAWTYVTQGANSCTACMTTEVTDAISTNPTQGAASMGDCQAVSRDAGYSLRNGACGAGPARTCAGLGANSCTACRTTEVPNAIQFTTDPMQCATSAED